MATDIRNFLVRVGVSTFERDLPHDIGMGQTSFSLNQLQFSNGAGVPSR